MFIVGLFLFNHLKVQVIRYGFLVPLLFIQYPSEMAWAASTAIFKQVIPTDQYPGQLPLLYFEPTSYLV